MRKVFALILLCVVACSLTACSQSQQSSSQVSATTPPMASPEASAPTASVQTVYGKITQITGNYMWLSLGNLPQDGLVQGSNDTVEQTFTMEDAIARGLDIDESSAKDLPVGSQVFMVAPAEDESGSADSTGGETASSVPQMELEYTGEVLDYTIPAGISILNLFGEEVTMNELTKGTIVMLTVDSSTQAITGIQVLGK